MVNIPFNMPPVAGRELEYISDVINRRQFSGNGPYTARCHEWLKSQLDVHEALLTNSCTTALEMSAILAGLETDDEVIMPSFTFVSTANAVVLRGAIPVFVDIRLDTLNINENLIEAAITPKTKAICVVHYAGVCAEMDRIVEIADRYGLVVIEDAAQALLSKYHERPAGQLGHLAAFSFHETKNITSGEGGALTINDPKFSDRAHIIWEKGTNRQAFKMGMVDKYSWVDIGSSFLPSEITAAALLAQLEQVETFTTRRLSIWDRYHTSFAKLELSELVRRPSVPAHCRHNGHLYYLVLTSKQVRDFLIEELGRKGILAPFHYIPLHSSPAGIRYSRTHGSLAVTDRISDTLIRLPLFEGMSPNDTNIVIESVCAILSEPKPQYVEETV